jgi:molybdenum cofactor biosynthesis protein B
VKKAVARGRVPGGRAMGVPAKTPRGGAGAESRARARTRAGSKTPHGRAAARPAVCAIVTVSDTRGPREDRTGDLAARLLERAGHRVAARDWTRDEPAAIRRAVRAALAKRAIDLVILAGGTGVALRDRTPEAVAPLLDRTLEGFGELFRARSFAAIGTAAWLSRAGAGIARGRVVVYLPGSPGAVELALTEVLLPQITHLLLLLGRVPRST